MRHPPRISPSRVQVIEPAFIRMRPAHWKNLQLGVAKTPMPVRCAISPQSMRRSAAAAYSHEIPLGYDMGHIAQAYRKLGNDAKFDDAMSRFKASLDAQLAEGADNWVLSRSRAHYAVLANDYEGAITLLENAFEQGAYIDTINATAWPVFKPLNGDPRYEAAKAAMVARLNEELEKMDFSDLERELGS